jgi:hypothetical protein
MRTRKDINSLKRRVDNAFDPLFQIRKDLKPIIDIKKLLEQRKRNDDGSTDMKMFYGGNKEECINDGCNKIKNIIIDLSNKYQEEINGTNESCDK